MVELETGTAFVRLYVSGGLDEPAYFTIHRAIIYLTSITLSRDELSFELFQSAERTSPQAAPYSNGCRYRNRRRGRSRQEEGSARQDYRRYRRWPICYLTRLDRDCGDTCECCKEWDGIRCRMLLTTPSPLCLPTFILPISCRYCTLTCIFPSHKCDSGKR